jgi:poly-gamma-glutamate synthesis protein (capsule biosynthesis protein)
MQSIQPTAVFARLRLATGLTKVFLVAVTLRADAEAAAMMDAEVTLFLCGDVMTGRGIDQVLPHPGLPHLYESHVKSARHYVELAEEANGPIPRPVDPAYCWGDALHVLDTTQPAARIINLETSITTSESAALKGINYRMHPENVAILKAAQISCAVLANNHVLDWGRPGLLETLDTLERAGIRVTGAGRDAHSARAPAILPQGSEGRILVFGMGTADCGIPLHWNANTETPGVQLLPDLSERTVSALARMILAEKRTGDIAIASVHWGSNWGYDIPNEHRRFAHALIDDAGIDIIHGHSSHHPRAIEVYNGRPILYGCGDFLDDYEGIPGYEAFRDDLVLMYFPVLRASTGQLVRFEMVPLQLCRFRLNHPSRADRSWLHGVLDRECRRFAHHIAGGDRCFTLEWQ